MTPQSGEGVPDVELAQRLAAIVEGSSDAIISKTIHGVITGWNPAAAQIFGYSAAEAIGQPLIMLFPPERLHEERDILVRIVAGEYVAPFETVRVRKDGRRVDVSVSISPIRDLSGRVIGASKIARDIGAQKTRESARQASEARYQALFDYAPDGILIGDPNSFYLDANPSMCRMLGYTRAELIGLHATDIIEGEVAQIAQTIDRINAGYQHEREWRFRRKDGSVFVAYVRSTKMPDGNLIGVIRDVTERYEAAHALERKTLELEEANARLRRELAERAEAERSLRDSEERFRQLAENTTEVFWITDLSKNQMLYVSPAFATIWGRSCASLYASPRAWLDAVHPDDRERVAHAALHKQIVGTYDETYRIVRSDGQIRWIHDRAFPVVNDRGEIYRMAGTAEDITVRRLAEERIEEQAALLDQTQDAILVRDLEHRILYWNTGAERLYGWTAAEAIGRSARDLLYRDPRSLDEATNGLTANGRWSGELRHLTRGGEERLVEARMTLLRDDFGHPKSVLAVNTDVTDRRRLETQFLRAQRMESLGTLAGGIAHDLNNILAPILMSVELLRPTARNDAERTLLETLESNTRRGAALVRQVLSFARGVTVERFAVDPIALVDDLLKVVRETFPKTIETRVHRATDVRTVVGDPTQLHQVFMNLFVNARDAMPDGGKLVVIVENISVDEAFVASHIDARPGTFIKISVIDSGMGIRPDVRSRVFEPFFTTKAAGKGTGLGLSTTMAIVRSHGGFIELESELGRGSRFDVYLPSTETLPPVADVAAELEPASRGHGELILVVDDEEAIRTVAKQMLEQAGHTVIVATNGEEAMSMYVTHQSRVAVIVSDMSMPVMDGSALVLALTSLNPEVRIVASSGLDPQGAMTETALSSVREFLPKPYTADDLIRAIRRAMI